MQQTENLKLNLIETGDPISPAPINENAEKLEAALMALNGADAALDARVTLLEAKKIYFGTYTGDGVYGKGDQTIDLGYSPLALIVYGHSNTRIAFRDRSTDILEITETGFVAKNGSNGACLNYQPAIYYYIAFV